MTDNTWSAKPFISHDAPDENGVRAEVKIILGYGTIKESKPSSKGMATSYSFEVANNEYNPHGWSGDANLTEMIEKAWKANQPIFFRIEQKRKQNVDRTKPFSEIAPPRDMNAAKENTFRQIAAVRFNESDDWTIGAKALTNPLEDPSASGAHSAANMSIEELRALSPHAAAVSAASPVWSEPQNLTTSLAPLELFNYVAAYTREHEELSITMAQQLTVATTLLKVINRVQVGIYDGGLERADMTLPSHQSARTVVLSTVTNLIPITNEVLESPDTVNSWAESVFARSVKMWKWGIGVVEAENGDES